MPKACIVNACIDLNTKSKIKSITIDDFNYTNNSCIYENLFEAAFGNTGNSVIGASIYTSLRKANWCVKSVIKGIPDATKINELMIKGNIDMFFLCMQDFIRPDCEKIWSEDFFKRLRQFIELTNGRYVVVSLGWNKLNNLDCDFNDVFDTCSNNTQNIVESIVKTARAIQVRDPELSNGLTNRYQDQNTYFLESGCPSLLSETLNSKTLTNRIKTLKHYGSRNKILVGGLFGSRDLSTIRRLNYIAQEKHEIDLQTCFYNDSVSVNHPHYLQTLSPIIANNKVFTFFDPWECKFISKNRFDYYVGTRLHGGITALKSGIPALFTSGDERTKRFCNQFKLPHAPNGSFIEDAKSILLNWDYQTTLDIQRRKHNSFISELRCIGTQSQ